MKTVTTERFKRELKKLSKQYSSINHDFESFLDSIEVNPNQGSPLGKDCYKVRMAIGSKNKGKSGGGRVITCVKIVKETIYLLSIYDKSEKENIDDSELNNLLKNAGLK